MWEDGTVTYYEKENEREEIFNSIIKNDLSGSIVIAVGTDKDNFAYVSQENGISYIGHRKGKKKHGMGSFLDANGKHYKGMFKDDKMIFCFSRDRHDNLSFHCDIGSITFYNDELLFNPAECKKDILKSLIDDDEVIKNIGDNPIVEKKYPT